MTLSYLYFARYDFIPRLFYGKLRNIQRVKRQLESRDLFFLIVSECGPIDSKLEFRGMINGGNTVIILHVLDLSTDCLHDRATLVQTCNTKRRNLKVLVIS